jgi:hypothetical protein
MVFEEATIELVLVYWTLGVAVVTGIPTDFAILARATIPSAELLRRRFLPRISSSSSVLRPPLIWIDIPLGRTTTFDVGLAGLVTFATVVVGVVAGVEANAFCAFAENLRGKIMQT